MVDSIVVEDFRRTEADSGDIDTVDESEGEVELRRRPWWLRLGAEAPTNPVIGCGEPDCDVARISPVDVYCDSHDAMIRLVEAPSTRARTVMINVLRVAICGAFLLTAQSHSLIPVSVLFFACAIAASLLPLRLYSTARIVVPAVWGLALLGVVALRYPGLSLERDLATAVLGSSIALWALFVGEAAINGGWNGIDPEPEWAYEQDDEEEKDGADKPEVSRSATIVATAFTATPAAVIALVIWTAIPADRLLALPRPVKTVLVLGSFGGVLTAMFIAALCGAIDGVKRVEKPAAPQWPKRRFRKQTRGHAKDGIERLSRAASAIIAAALHILDRIADVSHHLARWLQWHAVVNRRRVVATVKEVGRLFREGGKVWGGSASRATRVELIPVMAIAVAAVLTMAAADNIRRYLVHGSLVALGWFGLSAAAALLSASAVWIALSAIPLRSSLASQFRTTSITWPHVFSLTAIGGWLIGLPGTLGYGPIGVGWVTIGSSVLLIIALAVDRLRKQEIVDVTESQTKPAGAS